MLYYKHVYANVQLMYRLAMYKKVMWSMTLLISVISQGYKINDTSAIFIRCMID